MLSKYLDAAQQMHDELEGEVRKVRTAQDELEVTRLALKIAKARKWVTNEVAADVEQQRRQEAVTTLRAAQAKVAAAGERADELRQHFDPTGYVEDAWYIPHPAPIRTTWVSEVLRKHVAEEEGRPMETDDDRQWRARVEAELLCSRKRAELARSTADELVMKVKAVVARVEKDGGTEADAAALRDMRDVVADRMRNHDAPPQVGTLRATIQKAIAKLTLPAGMTAGAALIKEIERAPRLIEAVGRRMTSPTPDADQGDPIGNQEYIAAGHTPVEWGAKVKADAAARQARAEKLAKRYAKAAWEAHLEDDAAAASTESSSTESSSTVH